ncbi:unnamed protein product [Urochloa decumbens]|uniref:Uncharacterized protein n=1 Tax=Urochloa decumbens TaxID=240449 RepID=A0ABC8VV57_9POAL
MASGAYPVQLLHLPGEGGGAGQWRNLGAAYAAVTFLRPQGQSIVLYAAGPDGEQRQRIVFVYPILPGDAFERLDGSTLTWAEPESGDEFALCFLDDAACAAVCGAIAPVVRSSAVDGVAETLAGLRVAKEEPGGADIAAALAQLSIGRP